jgi:ribonuclease E
LAKYLFYIKIFNKEQRESKMGNKLVIDAAFPEETRVVLLNERNILENIDRETSSIKQLKGNIYLAKIIRIEPSLQSAFINYGGDKHGFLPMSDIHPDYYNIPEDKKTDLSAVKFFTIKDKQYGSNENVDDDDVISEATDGDFAEENMIELDENNEPILNGADARLDNPEIIDDVIERDGEDEAEYESEIRYSNFRKYKIENVLKEGQYLLVQVLKEERGNKGVALTTYLSMAGKYLVLMANVEGKGGISKKIMNVGDRKVLKSILSTLDPDNSKSIIVRTAGVGKKPEEILRDYAYLARLWKAIKQTALESIAPTFIHSEDDILKRTIRDLYNDKVKEIIVEGEKAFKVIKTLASLIIPEHEVVIKEHLEKVPLFYRYKVEDQMNQLYNNRVELSSGGYIIIDQTEALVAIDVNSGKATREKSVEEMALVTNIEAAKEIARQLRLRDIGGLIVIDFIDMFENKNRRIIERVMREETSADKAKVQVDKITIFGLLEMSRQRINASFSEKVNEKCSSCDGRGTVKSRYIVANSILRAIKYMVTREKSIRVVNVSTSANIVNFMFNYKRNEIVSIDRDYNVHVMFTVDNMKQNNNFDISRKDVLTPEEKSDLFPTHHIGKVNQLFDDDFLYNNEANEFDVNFTDDCFYEKDETRVYEKKKNANNIVKSNKKYVNNNKSRNTSKGGGGKSKQKKTDLLTKLKNLFR